MWPSEYDCMDWTDERPFWPGSGDACPFQTSFSCDEHICKRAEFSCGNGECQSFDTNRLKSFWFTAYSDYCQNLRELNYICEASSHFRLWTIDNGYCLPYEIPYDETVVDNNCSFYVKCALSCGLNLNCPCRNDTVDCITNKIKITCPDDKILYPHGALFTPYYHLIYLREHNWLEKTPDFLLYNGSIKCKGYQISSFDKQYEKKIDSNTRLLTFYLHEKDFCELKSANRSSLAPHYDQHCWNYSKTYNNRPYAISHVCNAQCMSVYRVRDGIYDCIEEHVSDEDRGINGSCLSIKHHRFQCSQSEISCLLAGAVGDSDAHCTNRQDEYATSALKDIKCEKPSDEGCQIHREYISHSPMANMLPMYNNISETAGRKIPFQDYCNSLIDTKSETDESRMFCEDWVCPKNQYRCLTKQCIPTDWVCDGEWDCSDASDEQKLIAIDKFDEHNVEAGLNLIDMKQKCFEKYKDQPFSTICNISTEFPCIVDHPKDPLNFTINRPCIDLNRIGDHISDCIGSYDERNNLVCEMHGMLGYHFHCSKSVTCIEYLQLCKFLCPDEHAPICFHKERKYKNGTISECNNDNDVMCLNDTCLKNARCNKVLDCPDGEDEYWCNPNVAVDPRFYREQKRRLRSARTTNKLPYYPFNDIIKNKRSNTKLVQQKSDYSKLNMINIKAKQIRYKTAYEMVNNLFPDSVKEETHYVPFICNRGVTVRQKQPDDQLEVTSCFCPPSFYGERCEYFSDHITIITHLDLSNWRVSNNKNVVIKVLALFLFNNTIIDYHDFHVQTISYKKNDFIKQRFYFLYPRTDEFINLKKNYRNGTQLYSVRFEAYELHINLTISIIGVWIYPIYFDFLPAFRLSKVLKLTDISTNDIVCSTNPCGNTGRCQPVINSNTSYVCLCSDGWYGTHCKNFENGNSCLYCNSKAICRPYYYGLNETKQTYCLCPLEHFGSTCHIKYDGCEINDCMNDGTCLSTYELTDNIEQYKCVCTNHFYGPHCQFVREVVQIQFSNITAEPSVLATIIQYCDVDNSFADLIIRQQNVYKNKLSHVIFKHDQQYAPAIGIIKLYFDYTYESQYFLVYSRQQKSTVNITTELSAKNQCQHVKTLFPIEHLNNKSITDGGSVAADT
ncbi:unnamed protein product, partial [Didymodactylos carnosus]